MDLFSLWERVLSYIKEENPQYYEKFYRRIYPVSFSVSTCSGETWADMPDSILAPRNVITVNLLTFIIFILLLIYC